ncbi:MAG: hypothetical protein AAFO70_06605 [Pseudomonadota bacterium]
MAIAVLIASLSSAGAQTAETFGPMTQSQAAFANLTKQLLGVWTRVVPVMTRRIDRSKVGNAAKRCTTPITPSRNLARALASAESEAGLPARTAMRGDVVFYLSDGKLRRLDFTQPSLVEASRWAEKTNPQGEPIFGVEFAGRVFAYYFNDFDIAPPGSGFVLEDRALYLKCPPLPERN